MNRRLVYTFMWPNEKRPHGLAMNCHMKGDRLRFFDTIRGHSIKGRITKDGENGFTFESAGFEPGPWVFKALTIEDFRRQTYQIVEGGEVLRKVIKTTPDLHEWYRKKFGQEAGLYYPDVLQE